MAIVAINNLLKDIESLGILMAHHQRTGIIAGRGTTCGASLCPLAALIA